MLDAETPRRKSDLRLDRQRPVTAEAIIRIGSLTAAEPADDGLRMLRVFGRNRVKNGDLHTHGPRLGRMVRTYEHTVIPLASDSTLEKIEGGLAKSSEPNVLGLQEIAQDPLESTAEPTPRPKVKATHPTGLGERSKFSGSILTK
jgi:hypothetical protein